MNLSLDQNANTSSSQEQEFQPDDVSSIPDSELAEIETVLCLISNLVHASYRSYSNPSSVEFHQFSRLSTEIRFRIWRFAVDAPQIVELYKERRNYVVMTETGQKKFFEGPWEFRAREIPALMLVNFESRQEALKSYAWWARGESEISNLVTRSNDGLSTSITQGDASEASKTVSPTKRLASSPSAPLFFRPDVDILYMKDFEFRSSYTGISSPGHHHEIQKVSPDVQFTKISLSTFNALVSVPEAIRCTLVLAVNREVFLRSSSSGEWLVKQYFPNLKLLTILIDDDSEIDQQKEWRNYAHYEGSDLYWEAESGKGMRNEFCEMATGPFELNVRNKMYKDYVENDVARAFEVEEELDDEYTAPVVIAAGCYLPEDIDSSLEFPGRTHPDDCWCHEED